MIRFLLCLCFAADTRSDWDTLRDKDLSPSLRGRAAESLVKQARSDNQCAKVVPELIDLALKSTTPRTLRVRIAEILPVCDSDDTAKLVSLHLGHGQPYERAFALSAARGLASPDLDKAIVAKALTDEILELRLEAVAILVAHKHVGALPAFQSILRSGKDPFLSNPIIAGVSDMLTGMPEWSDWETRLVELARSRDDEQRRSALGALARTKNVAHIELFLESLAHPDWSTRVLALDFLEQSGSKKAVAAIIAQMRTEPPGTRLHAACRGVLERLSGGLNLGDRAEDWATWWQNSAATFEFPRSSGAPRTPDRHPGRRSETGIIPQFYGIDIESQRVCFVIDISGSMLEATEGEADRGIPRFEVARRELGKIIDGLPPGSLFNIISFNAEVESWLDGIGDPAGGGGGADSRKGRKGPATGPREPERERAKTPEQRARDAEAQKKLDDALRAKARAWVNRLEALGGTNIHDALELAFADPLVDTIFFLTDGKPSVGREIEPERIREAVQRWNVTRRIKLNTIAIGLKEPLMRELAEENGGESRYFD